MKKVDEMTLQEVEKVLEDDESYHLLCSSGDTIHENVKRLIAQDVLGEITDDEYKKRALELG